MSIPTRCAVVDEDGVVINMIIAAPSDEPPIDTSIVEVMNEQVCDIGWTSDGATFDDPEAT